MKVSPRGLLVPRRAGAGAPVTPARPGPVTVSTYPLWDHEYLRRYHGALEPYGVVPGTAARIQDDFLREQAGRLDVLHFHWPEWAWRSRGEAAKSGAFRGVGGLVKYLRLARSLGVKVVWTVHNLRPHEELRASDWLGYVALARCADLVICHDRAARQAAISRFGASPARVMVMPHGNFRGSYPEPAGRAETLSRFGLDPGLRTLLAVGLIRPYKRTGLAVQAAKELGGEYQLVVAGQPADDRAAKELEALAAGEARVRLVLKWLDDQTISDLIGASDCVVMPYSRITGSGAFMLALSLGRGVVTSDLPYFRGVLRREPLAGVATPIRGPQDLAAGVRRFFAIDPRGRGAAASRLASEYDWPKVIRPVAGWYARTFPGRVRA